MPSRAAHSINECATLLPSPTNASFKPRNSPNCSCSVKISASAWQGWYMSLKALITGTLDHCAKASMVVCKKVRATMALVHRSRLRATSFSGSRSPIGPVVVTESILSSKGKKLKVGAATFNIDDVTNVNKQHQIKITYNDESGENPYDYGRIGAIQQRLELQDAKGNKIPANVQIYSWGQNNAQLQIMTHGAAGNAKIGPPAKLVYQLWIQLEHEVAFEFKELPLP